MRPLLSLAHKRKVKSAQMRRYRERLKERLTPLEKRLAYLKKRAFEGIREKLKNERDKKREG